ncbi:vWA domain-containing protein [Pedobacter deserti]|uniref:vWA domain-containing protein n=1 Tax=Pedobacter deserti TaxID=2817382 RepID=UPI002108A9B0|nr:VWA domain-containing protein [Pedobacter sp. SYSU D00382]
MSWFEGIEFADPVMFWLLLLVPLMIGWYIWKNRQLQGTLRMSALSGFAKAGQGSYRYLRHYGIVLRALAVAAMVVALARPQSPMSWQDSVTEGIDIVIATDISGSMLSEDLKPNRLEAGKQIAIDFIKDRPSDRIGLVVFSGESFTQCPLTIDHEVLVNLFQDVSNGMIEDGTAIGMGLATAVNRLKESEAKSKVVILLTDGSNTTGSIPPLMAAEIAKKMGVRVYTVGVGTRGYAPYPFKTAFGTQYQRIPVTIDEPTMKKIASTTGGQYFRATNNEALKAIYAQIDKLERAKIAVTQYHQKTERFLPWALIAAVLLLAEFLLRNTIFKGALT